jgi:WD40 repeat protein
VYYVSSRIIYVAEDGSIRVYDLSDSAQRTLCMAVRGLPDEISSMCIAQTSRTASLGRLWAASSKQVFLFDLDSDRMVIESKDAQDVITLIGEGEGGDDNVLNEVRYLRDLATPPYSPFRKIAVSKDLLAYSCDSGSVGVFDIRTRNRRLMKAMHSNVRIIAVMCFAAAVGLALDIALIHTLPDMWLPRIRSG